MDEEIIVSVRTNRYALGAALREYARGMVAKIVRTDIPSLVFDDSFMWSTRGAQVYVQSTLVVLSAEVAAVVNAMNVLLWDRAYEAGIDWTE